MEEVTPKSGEWQREENDLHSMDTPRNVYRMQLHLHAYATISERIRYACSCKRVLSLLSPSISLSLSLCPLPSIPTPFLYARVYLYDTLFKCACGEFSFVCAHERYSIYRRCFTNRITLVQH